MTLSDVKELMEWMDERSKDRHLETRGRLLKIEQKIEPLIADKAQRDNLKSWLKPVGITVIAGLILASIPSYVS